MGYFFLHLYGRKSHTLSIVIVICMSCQISLYTILSRYLLLKKRQHSLSSRIQLREHILNLFFVHLLIFALLRASELNLLFNFFFHLTDKFVFCWVCVWVPMNWEEIGKTSSDLFSSYYRGDNKNPIFPMCKCNWSNWQGAGLDWRIEVYSIKLNNCFNATFTLCVQSILLACQCQ